MPAQVIDFQKWKEAHPPGLLLFNRYLAIAVAWHRLTLQLMFPFRGSR